MSKILFLPFVNSFILGLGAMLMMVIAALDYANLLIIALGIFNVIVYTLLSFILIFCNIEFPRCAKKDDILKIEKKCFYIIYCSYFQCLLFFV